MPTARELLEQADALMRRNRARAVDTDIPELTEVIPFPASPATPMVLDDIPELTDAVEEIEISSIVEMPSDDEEAAAWLRSDADGASDDGVARAGAGQRTAADPGSASGRVLPLFATPGRPDAVSEGAAGLDANAPMDDAARREALGEEIRKRVLQRIDVFIGQELRGELGARLQPIVDRASAELMATISGEVGHLIRAHVTQAIEREIDAWRNGGG